MFAASNVGTLVIYLFFLGSLQRDRFFVQIDGAFPPGIWFSATKGLGADPKDGSRLTWRCMEISGFLPPFRARAPSRNVSRMRGYRGTARIGSINAQPMASGSGDPVPLARLPLFARPSTAFAAVCDAEAHASH